MLRYSRKTLAVLSVAIIAAIVGVGLYRGAEAGSQRLCPTKCGIKSERAPWAYSGDKVITGVCIKAGTGLFGFDKDGSNGCYTVTGLGTTKVVVSGGGTSRSCKDISNVVFYFDCGGADDF
jgi:hypothetical protein